MIILISSLSLLTLKEHPAIELPSFWIQKTDADKHSIAKSKSASFSLSCFETIQPINIFLQQSNL